MQHHLSSRLFNALAKTTEFEKVVARLQMKSTPKTQRYGLENYFTKAAVNTVLGMAIAQYFPLADDGKALDVPGYPKGRNGDIAAALTLTDLSGSDLHDILNEIRKRVE